MSNLSKEFQELTIIDNFMFIAVMQDPENSKMFLEMLFGVPIEINDGVTSIYLSTHGTNKDEVSKELVNFLDFVRAKAEGNNKDYGDAFVKQLQKSIEEIKQSREWGDRYMWLELMLEDEFDEGLEKGKAIGFTDGERSKLVSLVRKKIEKGNTMEEIADILEEDISVIREVVGKLTI